jgi:colicin import membrane protein
VKSNSPLASALEKPRQPGRIRSVFLAIFVHAAFFALIVFGVNWQSSPTTPVQAELWDKLPPAKAAQEKSQPPAPEPPKAEPPKPEPPKPEPPKPEPPKEEVKPPPKPDPAIAEKLEREKKDREKAEKQKRERLDKQREEEAKKKRERDEAAKKKLDDDKRRREEDIAKKEAEKVRAAAATARQAQIDGWVNKIKDKIRGRANVPDTVAGKPSVQVRIRILPGGEVLDISIARSSGNRAYDNAIERAIRSASPLPVPPPESELFPQFRDLILNIEHDR